LCGFGLISCTKLASDWLNHGVRQLQMLVTVRVRNTALFGATVVLVHLPSSNRL
jgi:hypothetical protein